MKILTTLLAFIWFLGWGFWFLYERGHIDTSSQASQNPAIDQYEDTVNNVPQPSPSISFLLKHPQVDSIDVIIDSLMSERTSDETVQIISYYDEREPYSGMNGNLGIQRSINLIQNASRKYAGRILQPLGLLLKENTDTTGISQYFQVEKILRTTPIRIINDSRVVIFFPFASGNERSSAKITQALDSLTNIWNTENNQLIITGYTDNTANTTVNYNLGLARAKSIQELIVGYNFPEEWITTLSRGEEDPISVNSTSDGRYLNRRVEILVDK